MLFRVVITFVHQCAQVVVCAESGIADVVIEPDLKGVAKEKDRFLRSRLSREDQRFRIERLR